MRNKLRQAEGGFTLVELLVVIAIIAVLATIILPGMGNIRLRANVLKCSKNLSGLYSGLVMYESEYKSYPGPDGPTGVAFWNLLRDVSKYTEGAPPLKRQHGLYVCPVKPGSKADVGDSMANCHYRGPAVDITYALDDSAPIGADIAKNHDPKNGKKPINVLSYGGKVTEVKDGSQEWNDLEPSDDNPGVTE